MDKMSINAFIDKLDNIPTIRDREALVKALRNLDQMIGMAKVKEAVIDQLKFLLTSDSMEGHMLHCVISGPPGVGKTQLGIVLAKIWNALGILKKPLVSQDTEHEKKRDIIDENKKLRKALNFIAVRSSEQRGKIRKLRNRVDDIKSNSRFAHVRRSISNPLIDLHNVNMDIMNEWTRHGKDDREGREEDVITITSRQDFIAKYVGQTDPKTLGVLNSNLGKVVFIDEAYSLINGDKDSFGNDALTTINRFMSEHPNEIIVIFAGYKEKLEDIFKAQPGLRRRCAWSFNVEGYTPNELSQIFKGQLKKDGWDVSSSVNLERFFEANRGSFKFYGGDTEKLCFYSKLAYGNAKFDRPDLEKKLINQSMLESAFKRFTSHQSEHKDKAPPSSMYM
jgi:DNA polymerase III delta prime subunit